MLQFLSIFLAIPFLTLLIIYIYFKYVFNYWKRRGVPSISPTFPFGNFGPLFYQQTTVGDILKHLYRRTSEPFIGIYAALRPTLLICDPALVRAICVSDFNHFSARGVYIDEVNDPLSGNLFALHGDKWKNLRHKLTPLFSTGKLKSMFPTLLQCGIPLQKYMDRVGVAHETIEMKEIVACYTTDIIASVAFGIEINSIDNPDTEFRAVGRKIFGLSLKNGLRMSTFLVWPELQNLLKFKTFGSEIEEFMIAVVKSGIEYRTKNNIIRKDLFQLLIELRDKGIINLKDDEWKSSDDGAVLPKAFTINEIAAQIFIFYIAAFETSSSTTSFCLYELAKRPDLQLKAQQEIDTVLANFNGELTYESISDMKYLESCVDETLRLYPPLPLLNRQCTIPYPVPGSDYVIESGTPIMIPLLALHRDSKYYSNPNTFLPERFHDRNGEKKTFIERPYLPFGDGPRNCIGLRLGKIQTLVALVLLLKNCSFELGDEMKLDVNFSPRHYVLTAESGLYLKVIKR